VVDRLIGEHAVAALAEAGRPWRQRVHDLALELRAGLRGHPGAAGLEAIPAEIYPRTAASASVIARYITTEQFTWGLDQIWTA
jgi:hypothetical protein